MAKFLDTQAISNELMRLIKEAKDKIILVSYSFKVNPQIQERLKTKSKLGTLSEIVIVYGRTELKPSELSWIREIQDLKIYEKNNLHAKCYLNEDRAIICSMNLYDYSQQTNIEMGILISKEHDKEAYDELIEEINNIKINGVRKKLEDLEKTNDQQARTLIQDERNIRKPTKDAEFTPEQKLKFQVLKFWRLNKSKEEKTAAFHILTDEEIRKISTLPKIEKSSLYEILPKKNVIRYGDQMIDAIAYHKSIAIGTVLSVWYQSDDSKYDRVKLRLYPTNEERWFDTTKELPEKDELVAVWLNGTWFNEYFYLNK